MFGGMGTNTNNYGTNPDAEMKKRAQMASINSLANGLLQAGFAGNDWGGFGKGIAGGVQGMGQAYKQSLMEDEEFRYKRGQREYQMDLQADEKKNRKEQMEEDDAMDRYHAAAVPALQETANTVKQLIMSSTTIPEEQKPILISKGEFLLNRVIKATYKSEDGSIKVVPKAAEDLQTFLDETGQLIGNGALRDMLADEASGRTVLNQGYGTETPNGRFEIGDGKKYEPDYKAFQQARRDRDAAVIESTRASAHARRVAAADNPKPNTSTDGLPSDSETARIRKEIFDDLSQIAGGEINKRTAFYDDDKVAALARTYGITNAVEIADLKKQWRSNPSSVIEKFAREKTSVMYPKTAPETTKNEPVSQNTEIPSDIPSPDVVQKQMRSKNIPADLVIKDLKSRGLKDEEIKKRYPFLY